MLYLNGTIGPKVEKVAVPEVANSTVEDATALLQSSGFEIKGIQYEATEDTEKGLVIRTIPAADTRQAVGTAVTLVVSSGKNFTVSDYTGQNIHSIKALLEAQGVVVTTTEVANGNYPAGTIIEQDVPEGTVWGAGETRAIHFTVTSGVSFIVPLDLSGRPVGEAKSELEAMGAVVSLKALPAGDNISEAGSYLTEPETVVAVDPQEGTLYEQTAASTITLSYYPAADVSFTIPSGLVGQPVQEVKAQLEGLGARVKLTQLPAEENLDPETEEYLHKPGTVVSVTPAEGSFYVQGSSSAIELTYY
jgi:serine/threonine-protein kinase